MWAKQIGCAHASDTYFATTVGCEQLFGHLDARAATRPLTIHGHSLGDRKPAVRAVYVQVFDHDELCASGRRAFQNTALERWELLGPAVIIGRIRAVVDVGRALACPSRVGWVGCIPAYNLSLRRQVFARAAVC